MSCSARLLSLVTVMAIVGLPARLRAEPQGNAGLTLGGAGVGSDGQFWDHAEFHLGLRGDVMFLREDPYDFGLGPYVEVGTFAFDQLQFGGGASVHLPIHDALPLVASLGPYGRLGDDPMGQLGVEPGIAGSLFWGSRSYNFHANYVMAAGLSLGYRHSFGATKESIFLVAAQIDMAVLGLPFVMLINAMRGPTDEARALP